MKQIISDLGEQLAELGKDTGKKFVKDVVKGIPRAAKGQIIGQPTQVKAGAVQVRADSEQVKTVTTGKKIDEITGKPPPSKKMLTHLSDAAAKLQSVKLQKIREELAKQKLKTAPSAKATVGERDVGPKIPVTPEDKKPKPEAVTRTLRQSQATGEIKGPIAG